MKRSAKIALVVLLVYLAWLWWNGQQAGASSSPSATLATLWGLPGAQPAPGSSGAPGATPADGGGGGWFRYGPIGSFGFVSLGGPIQPGSPPSGLQLTGTGLLDTPFLGLDPWGGAGGWYCAQLASLGGSCPPIRKSVL